MHVRRRLGPGQLSVTRFEPPPEYEIWWEEMKAYTGRREADFRRLRFFRVDAPLNAAGTMFPCDERGTLCPAFWEWPHDIYLAAGIVDSEWFVKHEMLHDLYQGGSEVRVEACLRTRLPFQRTGPPSPAVPIRPGGRVARSRPRLAVAPAGGRGSAVP